MTDEQDQSRLGEEAPDGHEAYWIPAAPSDDDGEESQED
jgi:hypothetical protein